MPPDTPPVAAAAAVQPREQREQTPPPAPAKRKPRGRAFPKGFSGNPGGKPKTGGVAGGPPGRATLLDDYRAVYAEDERHDRTPGRRALRQVLNKSPEKFITNYTRLEEAAWAAEGAAEEPPAPEPEADRGTEAALELIERLLAEMGAGVTPDGRCATCGQAGPATVTGAVCGDGR